MDVDMIHWYLYSSTYSIMYIIYVCIGFHLWERVRSDAMNDEKGLKVTGRSDHFVWVQTIIWHMDFYL